MDRRQVFNWGDAAKPPSKAETAPVEEAVSPIGLGNLPETRNRPKKDTTVWPGVKGRHPSK